jgi:hypothetical protein
MNHINLTLFILCIHIYIICNVLEGGFMPVIKCKCEKSSYSGPLEGASFDHWVRN